MHIGFVTFNVHPRSIFFRIPLLTLKNEDFDKIMVMFSVLNYTQVVALRGITQGRTYTRHDMKWKDEQY